jgi:hypothetical protein
VSYEVQWQDVARAADGTDDAAHRRAEVTAR